MALKGLLAGLWLVLTMAVAACGGQSGHAQQAADAQRLYTQFRAGVSPGPETLFTERMRPWPVGDMQRIRSAIPVGEPTSVTTQDISENHAFNGDSLEVQTAYVYPGRTVMWFVGYRRYRQQDPWLIERMFTRTEPGGLPAPTPSAADSLPAAVDATADAEARRIIEEVRLRQFDQIAGRAVSDQEQALQQLQAFGDRVPAEAPQRLQLTDWQTRDVPQGRLVRTTHRAVYVDRAVDFEINLLRASGARDWRVSTVEAAPVHQWAPAPAAAQ